MKVHPLLRASCIDTRPTVFNSDFLSLQKPAQKYLDISIFFLSKNQIKTQT